MKKTYSIFTFLLISLAFLSCNKKGCSDPLADNYVKNVKKARDAKCQYNGEGICGENIRFCFEINGTKRTGGSAKFFEGSPGAIVKRIIWTNGQATTSSNYEDVVIEIFGNDENTSYSFSNSGTNKTFKASYLSGQNNTVVDAVSGNLKIKKDNTEDGLIVTFDFTTANGVQVKRGNVYKLK